MCIIQAVTHELTIQVASILGTDLNKRFDRVTAAEQAAGRESQLGPKAAQVSMNFSLIHFHH